jgi:signal transduction histidine kinase
VILKFLRRPNLDFFHSIRFRLTLWFVCILALVLAAFSSLIYFVQARDLQIDELGRIQDKFAHVTGFFSRPDWQSANLTPGDVPGGGSPLQPGDLLILTGADGTVLGNWGAKPIATDQLVSELISEANVRRQLTVYEQNIAVTGNSDRSSSDYLLVISPVFGEGHLLGYLIIGSPSLLSSELHRLMLLLILGSLGMLALAYFGGLWLADRAMRPVKTISQAARSIGEGDLSRRLNLRGRDELALLADTFDGMLARLESAFDRQRRFIADASHELRTPLTIINLEVGRVLTSKHSEEEYQKALHTVESEGRRMSRLVNNLLTLARMDSGLALPQLEAVDLGDVALEAVERLQPLAGQRDVKLELGELPELAVRGDRGYLVQMISNLVENGIKYGGAGKTVKIEIHPEADWAVVTVSDDGPGIAPDQVRHIFDRFYRVDEARGREESEDPASPTGSGLGLSIVASIVQLHGGQIEVRSGAGGGSTFEVRLPLSVSSS